MGDMFCLRIERYWSNLSLVLIYFICKRRFLENGSFYKGLGTYRKRVQFFSVVCK